MPDRSLKTVIRSLLPVRLVAAVALATVVIDADAQQSPAPRGANAPAREGARAQASDGISGKVLRYASKLVAKHDVDLDGRLQEPEWRRMSGTPRLADLDGDGIITVEELSQRVASYSRQRTLRLMPAREAVDQATATAEEAAGEDEEAVALEGPMNNPAAGEQAPDGSPMDESGTATDDRRERRQKKSKQFFVSPSRLPKGVAKWFSERDANGDGQVSMVEYSSKWSQAEALEFARYDKNGDGIITPDEATVAGGKRVKSEPSPATSADAGAPAAIPPSGAAAP